MMAKGNSAALEAVEATGFPAVENQQDLYDIQLETFRNELWQDIDQALERYGFAFFFSLSPSERIRIKNKLGLSPTTAVEFYNAACVAIEDGNFAEAQELLKKALELDPKLADAAYNLALCYERQGLKSEAKKAWDTFLSLCNDPALKEQIVAHVAELTSH
jgi:tetratricopeptide (TPR) repeat protein